MTQPARKIDFKPLRQAFYRARSSKGLVVKLTTKAYDEMYRQDRINLRDNTWWGIPIVVDETVDDFELAHSSIAAVENTQEGC